MENKITIIDIAKMAGVSTATVSRILNGKVTDSAKRELVLSLVEQYNYKPSAIAQTLQSSKSKTVGVVVPHINSPFYAQLFYEIESAAQKKGYTLILCNSESNVERESQILEAFISANVRAILFMGGRLDNTDLPKKYLNEIERINQKVSIVSFVDIPCLDCIQVYQETKHAANHLMQRLADSGYTDISLMGGYAHIRTTMTRRKEIQDIASQYGIHIRKEIIESDYSVEGGNVAMQTMLKKGSLPKAIICINDLVAIGALNEAQNHKLLVPQDIAIIGYDNVDVSPFIYPGLTTIACEFKEYSQAVVDVIENIENILPKTRIAIPSKFIVRGTI